MINPHALIKNISGITPKYKKVLEKFGIQTIQDLLFHFPFRYDDYTKTTTISGLQNGLVATIEGEIIESRQIKTWKKRMRIAECYIKDRTGYVRAVWFNQPFVANSLTKGKYVRISGKVSSDKNGIFFSNPSWENSQRKPTNTGRLVPVYPETEGLTSKWLRWQIQNFLRLAKNIPDPIPEKILKEIHLPSLSKALQYIHFPETEEEYLIAQKRFAFQEMFFIQIASAQIRSSWKKQSAEKIPLNPKLMENFTASLPFELTNAQKKSVAQISKDLEKDQPMNRLLNGDVGSGKTLVAAIASLQVAESGHQTAIMAPTEVLAKQHFLTLSKIFKNQEINIALLTNSYKLVTSNQQPVTSNKEKKQLTDYELLITDYNKLSRNELLNKIKDGEIDIIIGTHAIIQKDIRFKKLALVIVDEQHRFGVAQRAYLQQEIKNINDGLPGKIPHFLSMTATPIPRTLSLAFFGNLDISVLDEMPKNRKPVITKIVEEKNRQKAYDFVKNEIQKGRQAFVIFPLVEESKALNEVKAAKEEHQRLSENIFPNFSLGLLHGKLKSSEKEKVMEELESKKYDILVATSVVEVGIDIPNASVIIIEDADRFGLSQLHQFRGRVGRGQHQSYCFLFSNKSTKKSGDRLGALVKSNSGFDIAEKDLALRGPGQFFGNRQSGLPDITMANIANVKLIEISKKYSDEILQNDPDLKNNPLLAQEVEYLKKNTHLE